MSSLAFFLMVLHIFAHSVRCLLSPLSAISRRFFIRARVGDDVLDFCGLLIALAALDALCWIMSVMVSLMVSMLSSSCNVPNRYSIIIRVGIRSSLILLSINIYDYTTSNFYSHRHFSRHQRPYSGTEL